MSNSDSRDVESLLADDEESFEPLAALVDPLVRSLDCPPVVLLALELLLAFVAESSALDVEAPAKVLDAVELLEVASVPVNEFCPFVSVAPVDEDEGVVELDGTPPDDVDRSPASLPEPDVSSDTAAS